MVTLFDNDYTELQQHRYTLAEIHEAFGLDLGLRDYPIFDESYRETLNTRIYEHFRYRRIAAQTPQLFVYYLNRHMNERMPAYNEIYKRLAREDFDPYLTSERTDEGTNRTDTTSEANNVSTSEAKAEATALSRNITSQTPASFMDDPNDPKYMSNLVQGTSESTSDNRGSTTSADTAEGNVAGEFETTSKGRSGYLGDAILSSLATGFLNTDLMVCDMLEPLFMQVWDDQPL